MPYQFFFSYARGNSDLYLEKFFKDLSEEVRVKSGLLADEIGFRDARDIETGDIWLETLENGLQTSRVLVCLCSPHFVNREWCGKEFQVFQDRIDHYLDSQHPRPKRPRAILPIVWVPVKGLPQVLQQTQKHDSKLPKEYQTEGLRYLMQRTLTDDLYREFVTRFAEKVVAAASGPELPMLPDPPSLDRVQSAFHAPPSAKAKPPPVAEVGGKGPNSAKFVFLAARPDEMPNHRTSLQWYSDDGGWFWRPYLPTENQSVGSITQTIAGDENLCFVEIQLDQDKTQLDEYLADQLAAADQKKQIVVIVVDAWATEVPRYLAAIRSYDAQQLINCGLLVPWNDADPDTAQYRVKLEAALRVALKAKHAAPNADYFKNSIRSAEKFREELRDTLVKIRMHIIDTNEAEKLIALEPVPPKQIAVPS